MFETLTQLLPRLSGCEYGTWIVDRKSKDTIEDPIHMPFVGYSQTVKELERAVYRFADNHKEYELNRYADILKSSGIEWQQKSMSEADVSNADAQLIMALLIGALRAERFCEGAMLSFCEDGSILRWLNRLKEIDNAQ